MASYQVPGGPYVNETGTLQTQIPGGAFLNQSQTVAYELEVEKGTFTLTGNDATFDHQEAAPVAVVTTVVGDGESWEDYVRAVYEQRHLRKQLDVQKRELKKVEKKLEVVKKKVSQQKTEGILANLYRLELKKSELENKIRAIEIDLKPLILAIEKEIEEDDQEFMMLQ